MILSVQVLYLSLQPSSFLPNTPSRGLISTNRSFLRDSARILAHSGPKTKQRSILCSQRLHLKLQSRSHACIVGDTPHPLGQFHLPHCFHHRSHQPSKATTLPFQSKCRINTLTHHESVATAWAASMRPRAICLLLLSTCQSTDIPRNPSPSSSLQHRDQLRSVAPHWATHHLRSISMTSKTDPSRSLRIVGPPLRGSRKPSLKDAARAGSNHAASFCKTCGRSTTFRRR